MLTQIKTKYKSDDISVCILGSVKEYREATKQPVVFSKISHYQLLDLQIDAIKNVFPKSDIYLTLPEIKKKLYRQIYGNINVIENVYDQGHGLEIKICLQAIKSQRILFIDSATIFDEHTLMQLVGKNSCTLINRKVSKNKQYVSASGSNTLHHLSYGLPHQWSKMILFDSREVGILNRIRGNINNKMELYECINSVIDNGGKIHSSRHTRGLLGHIHKGNLCAF